MEQAHIDCAIDTCLVSWNAHVEKPCADDAENAAAAAEKQAAPILVNGFAVATPNTFAALRYCLVNSRLVFLDHAHVCRTYDWRERDSRTRFTQNLLLHDFLRQEIEVFQLQIRMAHLLTQALQLHYSKGVSSEFEALLQMDSSVAARYALADVRLELPQNKRLVPLTSIMPNSNVEPRSVQHTRMVRATDVRTEQVVRQRARASNLPRAASSSQPKRPRGRPALAAAASAAAPADGDRDASAAASAVPPPATLQEETERRIRELPTGANRRRMPIEDSIFRPGTQVAEVLARPEMAEFRLLAMFASETYYVVSPSTGSGTAGSRRGGSSRRGRGGAGGGGGLGGARGGGGAGGGGGSGSGGSTGGGGQGGARGGSAARGGRGGRAGQMQAASARGGEARSPAVLPATEPAASSSSSDSEEEEEGEEHDLSALDIDESLLNLEDLSSSSDDEGSQASHAEHKEETGEGAAATAAAVDAPAAAQPQPASSSSAARTGEQQWTASAPTASTRKQLKEHRAMLYTSSRAPGSGSAASLPLELRVWLPDFQEQVQLPPRRVFATLDGFETVDTGIPERLPEPSVDAHQRNEQWINARTSAWSSCGLVDTVPSIQALHVPATRLGSVLMGGTDESLRCLATVANGLAGLSIGTEATASCAQLSHDHDWLAQGWTDGHISMLRINGDQTASFSPYTSIHAHTCPVSAVAVSASCNYLLSTGVDGTVRLWSNQVTEAAGSTCKARYADAHGDAVWGVRFSENEAYFVTSSLDQTALLWRTDQIEPLRAFLYAPSAVESSCFHPSNRYILSGTATGEVCMWSVEDGTMVRVLTGHSSPVTEVACDAEGFHAASVDARGCVIVWDLGLARPIAYRRLPQHAAGTRFFLHWVPFEPILLVTSARGLVCSWNIHSTQQSWRADLLQRRLLTPPLTQLPPPLPAESSDSVRLFELSSDPNQPLIALTAALSPRNVLSVACVPKKTAAVPARTAL